MMSANPLLRQLFPDQSFANDNPIQTETMTFLATAINNVETIYESLGETEAYGVIQRHHVQLAAADGDTLLTEVVYSDRAVIEQFTGLGNDVEVVRLPIIVSALVLRDPKFG